jgi:hypothetical protein
MYNYEVVYDSLSENLLESKIITAQTPPKIIEQSTRLDPPRMRSIISRHAILIPSSTETPECLPDIHEGPPNLAESNGRRGRAQALTVV